MSLTVLSGGSTRISRVDVIKIRDDELHFKDFLMCQYL